MIVSDLLLIYFGKLSSSDSKINGIKCATVRWFVVVVVVAAVITFLATNKVAVFTGHFVHSIHKFHYIRAVCRDLQEDNKLRTRFQGSLLDITFIICDNKGDLLHSAEIYPFSFFKAILNYIIL